MSRRFRIGAQVAVGGVGLTVAAWVGFRWNVHNENKRYDRMLALAENRSDPPSRGQMVAALRKASESGEKYDVVVIGGGCTGCGVALDAVSRGLSVLLLERGDFATGTSSRSTKLIHGGVRYLEAAFLHGDLAQLLLVREALREREHLHRTAPHLTRVVPILVPVYAGWFELLKSFVGLRMYDAIASSEHFPAAAAVSATRARALCPALKAEGLYGGVVFHDGMHNDARMALAVGMTAAQHGAVCVNYASVARLVHDAAGRVSGVAVRLAEDGGKELTVAARCVVNATGVEADQFLPPPSAGGGPVGETTVVPSSGAHLALSGTLLDRTSQTGVLSRSTDGRVMFLLPFEGAAIAGTTDTPVPAATPHPTASAADVDFILENVAAFLSPLATPGRRDVLSAWAGLRPLAKPTRAQHGGGQQTATIVRSHVVAVRPDGLVGVAGGKWTTYRQMAEDVVQAALGANPQLAAKAGPSRTHWLPLWGAAGYSPLLPAELVRAHAALRPETAHHLVDTYGGRALAVASRIAAAGPGGFEPLAPGHPAVVGEVAEAVAHEWAVTPADVLARRQRLCFTDAAAAAAAVPTVVREMARHLGWSAARTKAEAAAAAEFVATFVAPPPPPGGHPPASPMPSRLATKADGVSA